MSPLRRPASDPRRFVHAHHRLSLWLTARGVGHVVIGGVATACYVPRRAPGDLDVVLRPDGRGPAAAERALGVLVLRRHAAERDAVAPFTAKTLARGAEVRIGTDHGPLHVVGDSLPHAIDRAEIVRDRSWFLIGGVPMPVCSLDALIAIKEQHDSETDRADLRLLSGRWGTRHRAG